MNRRPHWYKNKTPLDIIACIILWILLLAVSFLFTAGIIKLISMCFEFVFTWKLAFGIWLVLTLLSGFFGSRKS